MREAMTDPHLRKAPLSACPYLPDAKGPMSYRDLREAEGSPDGAAPALFEAAGRYAQYLWGRGLPARALLALCRAIYLPPAGLPPSTRQPFEAVVWILRAARQESGFLGNPRISFAHQALRMAESQPLKRQRAWALWRLTRASRPELPPDPQIKETPPAEAELERFLNQQGLPGEGTHWRTCLLAMREG